MDTKQIIKSLGGVSATARLCEVSSAAVSQWQTEGIPKSRLMFLKLARPEVFAVPGQAEPSSVCKTQSAQLKEAAA